MNSLSPTIKILSRIHGEVIEEKIKEGMELLGRTREEIIRLSNMSASELMKFLNNEMTHEPKKFKKLCVVCDKPNSTYTDYCSRGCMRTKRK